MDREEILAKKRQNSRRLRSNPEYKKSEAEKAKIYNQSPERKHKKVSNQINYERVKKYGITKEQYMEMLKEQNYSCAICKIHISELTLGLCIDHDHKLEEQSIMKVRGLLCQPCNTSLGHIEKYLQNPNKILTYLRKDKQ